MTDIFSAAGSIAGAAISADAMRYATNMQIDALQRQADRMYTELDPTKISDQALAADIQKAKQRLALQQTIDPALLQTRYAGQQKILENITGLGQQASDEIAALAAQSGRELSPKLQTLKDRIIDSALADIDAGAALPEGVQAELVKAGLEQGGLVSGSVDPRGISGNITRRLIGERALQLQRERQQNAASLAASAAGLESARTGILSTLFPTLKQQEGANLGMAQSALAQANELTPEAGLSGADIVNLIAARVGAGNQIAQEQADAMAARGLANANIWQQGIGGATGALTSSNAPTGAVLNKLWTNLIS